MHKKGFTLIELVMGMVVIGVGLSAIMMLLNYATKIANTTKAQIVATNLAREWLEIIQNKRDTNWRIYSSKRDLCWLVNKTNPTSTTCESIDWMTPEGINGGTANKFGVLSGNVLLTWNSIIFPISSPLSVKENTGVEINATIANYRMCFANNTRDYCNNFSPVSTARITKYGQFWRMITIQGLYDKTTATAWGTALTCTNGSDPTPATCGTSAPKELRVCSRVDYTFDGTRSVELCTVLTNFLK
jgi:prepilin-type N-terminal cleavage/methylation domain-containing protein